MNLHPNVKLIRPDVYEAARRIAYSAEDDWLKILGAAETLSQSPNHTDTMLARQLRQRYTAYLREQVEKDVLRQAEETPLRIAMRHRHELLEVCVGLLLAVLVAVAFGAVVL